MSRKSLLASNLVVALAWIQPNVARAEDLQALWSATLGEHLHPTQIRNIDLTGVDYPSLSRGDENFRKTLEILARDEASRGTEKEALAFWINAYNVLAVAMVVDHWPVDSIRDAGGLVFGKVWDKKAGKVAGESRTLNEIEHTILRKMNEPRIHVAIVCASVSCPDLRSEAYRGDRLDAQLDEQMSAFLANEEKGARLQRSSATLYLSPIFDWFSEDFEGGGSVLDYLLPYLPKESRDWIESNQRAVKIRYLDYDWGLNISNP